MKADKKIKIKDEELRIEKKWHLTYFCLGFGVGFVCMLFLIILSMIPFVKTLDEFKPLDLQLVQNTNKTINFHEEKILDECNPDHTWAIISYHKDTPWHADGFFCKVKGCNEQGYCKDIEIKLNIGIYD